ncbi:hypothetical protein LSG31_14555 [Fodinisporobacter ferrooxydans]|uniref:Uncharacterized protein n=1 Tax=Fodinisporobacter ferrooxydans TaxID=2901836 RepID=A0ABY4CIZ4_9BACL|nr:hypothetical protein LSG31_14555 [Alicyclobacillaceae bacterium MYW30-H2]
MKKYLSKGKRKTNRASAKHRRTIHSNNSSQLQLDGATLGAIAKEADFLGLTVEEYCKLVFTSAQVLRETTLQKPLSDAGVLKSVIGSPLLLSLVKSFASNFLTSSLQDLLTNLQNPSAPSNHTPQHRQSQQLQLPQPFTGPYPPTSYWHGY